MSIKCHQNAGGLTSTSSCIFHCSYDYCILVEIPSDNLDIKFIVFQCWRNRSEYSKGGSSSTVNPQLSGTLLSGFRITEGWLYVHSSKIWLFSSRTSLLHSHESRWAKWRANPISDKVRVIKPILYFQLQQPLTQELDSHLSRSWFSSRMLMTINRSLFSLRHPEQAAHSRIHTSESWQEMLDHLHQSSGWR